jgi:hypothetical protein
MKQKNFKLIDGTFEPEEARNILFSLVNTKINFHSMEAFGIAIRSSGDTSYHDKRISELTKMNLDLKVLLEEARGAGLDVKITGDIAITVVEKKDVD